MRVNVDLDLLDSLNLFIRHSGIRSGYLSFLLFYLLLAYFQQNIIGVNYKCFLVNKYLYELFFQNNKGSNKLKLTYICPFQNLDIVCSTQSPLYPIRAMDLYFQYSSSCIYNFNFSGPVPFLSFYLVFFLCDFQNPSFFLYKFFFVSLLSLSTLSANFFNTDSSLIIIYLFSVQLILIILVQPTIFLRNFMSAVSI